MGYTDTQPEYTDHIDNSLLSTMSYRRRINILILSTVLGSMPAVGTNAGESVSQLADPSVEFVTSGGWWESKAERGTYRVIVVSGGFEHVFSEITLQRIGHPTEHDQPQKVVSSETFQKGMMWRVARPELRFAKSRVFFRWRAIFPHMSLRQHLCEIELLPQGGYRVITKCWNDS